ncbi:MAG: nucleotidyltransferase domain-containing protein [Chloroflexi bacterium]|nr:nucleotidyltransferase domain-containing protein [Ardenticatenaceae bacterium]MBL1130996.1 nucleotidyltransferase domain-containing protein [Chloroflexota bacterium]NOG37094.1 nucleotidyltransferase domain-containing protein [Chloroflexota bacterium]
MKVWCHGRTVQLCVLFGSQATGKARTDSDIDLALWVKPPPEPLVKLRWLGELIDLLGKEVNVVWVGPDTNPVLGFEIVRDGRVLFEREPGIWATKQLHLWHAYTDAAPFRRLAREQMRQFAAEVHDGS